MSQNRIWGINLFHILIINTIINLPKCKDLVWQNLKTVIIHLSMDIFM